MNRRLSALLAPVVVAVMVCLLPEFAMAQVADTELPRTPWGDPDIQGVWNNNTVVPLERPPDLAGRETLTDEEVAERLKGWSDQLFTPTDGSTGFYNEFWFEYGLDTNRTSLLVDPAGGRLPALTPRAKDKEAALQAHRGEFYEAPNSWLDINIYDRCITRSLPGSMMPGYYNNNYHILQTRDYVAFVVEMIHDARIIPLDGRRHVSLSIRQWLGDSRAYWDGDTLVIETTNFNDKGDERGPTVFGASEHLRLVERFTRIDADTMDYRFTVEDPTTFTVSWTAATPMNKIDGPIFEYACHEGNYSLPNMLSGTRATEAGNK